MFILLRCVGKVADTSVVARLADRVSSSAVQPIHFYSFVENLTQQISLLQAYDIKNKEFI